MRGRKPKNAQTDKHGDFGHDPAKEDVKRDSTTQAGEEKDNTVEGSQNSEPHPYVDPNQADIDHYKREDEANRKEFARRAKKND